MWYYVILCGNICEPHLSNMPLLVWQCQRISLPLATMATHTLLPPEPWVQKLRGGAAWTAHESHRFCAENIWTLESIHPSLGNTKLTSKNLSIRLTLWHFTQDSRYILEIRTEEDIISKTTVQASSANTGPLQHCRLSMIVHGWVDGPPITKVWKSTKIEKSKDGKCRVRTQVWNHQPPAMYLAETIPYMYILCHQTISHHTAIIPP